jgi:alpha-1,2-mannosyltransferase
MGPPDQTGGPRGRDRLTGGTVRVVRGAARLPTTWIAAAAVVVWVLSAAFMIHFGAGWHLDLRVYRAAGHSLYHGGSPFDEVFTPARLPFTYTPFALLVLSPLSLGALWLVESVWWGISAACLVVASALMIRSAFDVPTRRAWATAALTGGLATLILEPVRSNFDFGQINVVLMLMVVADLTWVRGRTRGVLVGLAAAVKLTPLIYLVYFGVGRDWRALLRGTATLVAATAVSWAILPSGSARYWLHEFFDAKRTGPLGIVSNQSWNGMVHRAPFDGSHLGTLVWLALSLATLAVGVVLTRWLVGAGRAAEAVMVLALAEVLVSPVSWTHHWSWLALAPIVAASVARVHRSVAVALATLVALAVVTPYLWLRHGILGDVASNTLVLGAAAVLVVWLVAVARGRRGPAGDAPGTPERSDTRSGQAG